MARNKTLENAEALMRGSRRLAARRCSCKGLDWDELNDALEASVADDDLPILEEIDDGIDAYESRPAEVLGNGTTHEHSSGFRWWLNLLQAGQGSLPATMPTSVLLAWRDGYLKHRCFPNSTPIPIWRCPACKMILPNCEAGGGHGFLKPCPVCHFRGHFESMQLWDGEFAVPLYPGD